MDTGLYECACITQFFADLLASDVFGHYTSMLYMYVDLMEGGTIREERTSSFDRRKNNKCCCQQANKENTGAPEFSAKSS